MKKPKHHIFVCKSFRGEEVKGLCAKQSQGDFLSYIDYEISDRGLDAMVTASGCLKMCEKGPVMVVYPKNWWFGNVKTKEDIDEILDALEEERPAESFLIQD
ncbi:MAG: (2Fe-2S) ferredoxin domain-containing protein [Desulforegulaceae bacterium]|nr:(2Fe-2S) ferredoxin domain-containing protein [Desulforegulaceae bacterium]